MERSMFNHRRDGLPEIVSVETETFSKERYEDLLREAEEYRMEHRAKVDERPSRHMVRSLIAPLIILAGMIKSH